MLLLRSLELTAVLLLELIALFKQSFKLRVDTHSQVQLFSPQTPYT